MTPIERPLHERLFALAGVTHAEAATATVAPTNLAYQNHMLSVAARGTSRRDGGGAPALPVDLSRPRRCRRWTWTTRSTRSGPRSTPRGCWPRAARAWRELGGRRGRESRAAQPRAMRRVFHLSMRYEWMFWQMAYTRERWPIE